MLSTAFLAASAFSLLAGVNAHMVITSPVPFDKGALNNSPLAADGSDFPCKFGGATGYTSTVTQMNNVQVGTPNNVSFMGSAVHGGGSCQLSVTLDKTPTKNSVFKVVHSIIGGCPAAIAGNVPADSASYTGPPLNSYEWTLPKGMPNGQYTFAWTWFNKIGNREMYMNCAPIDVSGGDGTSANSVFNGLPDLFVANIGNGCSDTESTDVQFPDPGDSVETGASATPTPPTGSCGTSAAGGASGSASASATAAPSSSAAGSPSSYGGGMIGSSPTSAASSAAASNAGGVFAPGASSAAATTMATSLAPVPAASTSAPVAAAPSSAAPAASSAAPSSGGSSSGSAAGEVDCTAEGFYCISATTFGMCANGKAVPQAVADGTACTDGKIDFASKQVVPGTKRETSKYARHFRTHGHHRRNALGYDF